MATRESTAERARRSARRDVDTVLADLREARLASGLSQDVVAAAIGVSQAHVSRIEAARGRAPGLELMAAHASVLGLRLRIQAYPDGEPIRDRAQLRLLAALRARLPAEVAWRTEVPLPIEGDRRAWDAVLMVEEGWTAIEAETRLRDIQATQRRIELKRRDDPRVGRVVILVADTARNRTALVEAGPQIRRQYPLGTREVLGALGAGVLPALDGIAILRA
jgi:transcriptional regulator with XRE-family HTH domain